MAEYVDYSAESNLTSDQEFKGYSVEAGYFLTGESYKWKKGYNSGVSPKSKYGAWQLVARFENIETAIENANSLDVHFQASIFTKNIDVALNHFRC